MKKSAVVFLLVLLLLAGCEERKTVETAEIPQQEEMPTTQEAVSPETQMPEVTDPVATQATTESAPGSEDDTVPETQTESTGNKQDFGIELPDDNWN